MTARPLLLIALVGLTAAGILLSVGFGTAASIVLPVAYGGAGAYVVARRPRLAIGWLLIATGWGCVLGGLRVDASATTLLANGLDPFLAFTAWANAWGFALAFAGLAGVTAIFPDGHLPTGPWRPVIAIAMVVAVAIAVLVAIRPEILPSVTDGPTGLEMPNPYAVAPSAQIWQLLPASRDLYPLMIMSVLASGIALVARSRRATGAARLQYRWFITSLVLVVATSSGWAIAVEVLGAEQLGPTYVLALISFTAVPIAIAIAVLRYRLFEIDRIISRSIGWALVTGILVAVFAGGVLALQAALTGFTQGQTLAVATSTLVAFALFQPLRGRVQRAVDRRFDRARYDGERTAAAFAERLRDEIDLASLRATLVTTANGSLRPQAAGVWLRARQDRQR